MVSVPLGSSEPAIQRFRAVTGLAGVRNQVQRPPSAYRLQRMLDLARRDQHMRARRRRDLRRLDLGEHAAARQFGFRRARHAFDFRGDGLDDRNQFCVGIGAGRRVIKPVDIGQQDQQIGARHGGDARGEAIIVAIADFVGGHRVVLVDHGHRAPFQQFADGRAGVEIAAALLGVLQRHQNLSGADAVSPEHFRPDPRQRDLSHGGGALAFLEFQRDRAAISGGCARAQSSRTRPPERRGLRHAAWRYRRPAPPATPSEPRPHGSRSGARSRP